MALPPPSTPVAPEFVGYRDGRPVRVRFDQERSTIVTTDEQGRPASALPWTEESEPLRIERDEFVCQWAPTAAPLRLAVHDDDYGMALAFVEFVNRRKPDAGAAAFGEVIPGARRFQYAVVEIDVTDARQRLAEVLAHAGSRGWEVVSVHDRASNWFGGPEQGFVLFKREIPDTVEVSTWCVTLRA